MGDRPSALVDTRVIYRGDNLEQLRKLPADVVDRGSVIGDWHPAQEERDDRVGRPDIDAFEAMLAREERKKGFFVAFDYTQDALTEVDRFLRQTSTVTVPLTVKEILEEQIARKLA